MLLPLGWKPVTDFSLDGLGNPSSRRPLLLQPVLLHGTLDRAADGRLRREGRRLRRLVRQGLPRAQVLGRPTTTRHSRGSDLRPRDRRAPLYMWVFFKHIPAVGYDDIRVVKPTASCTAASRSALPLLGARRDAAQVPLRRRAPARPRPDHAVLPRALLGGGRSLPRALLLPVPLEAYDYLEEFTTLTEFMVLLLGLGSARSRAARTAPRGGSADRVGLRRDLLRDDRLRAHRRPVRALPPSPQPEASLQLDVIMSPTIFNLEFGQHLLVNYLAQATPQRCTSASSRRASSRT